jgi:hypothetical protein
MSNVQRRRPSHLEAVEPVRATPQREPSRMMGLLIVDVLAANPVRLPAAKSKKASKKSARG